MVTVNIGPIKTTIADYKQILYIFGFLMVVLIIVFLLCLYNLGVLLEKYYSIKSSSKALTRIRTTSNNPVNERDDNEVYNKAVEDDNIAEKNDEYMKFTKQINKSISEYQVYNSKLQTYYRDNKPGEEPTDLINKDIIDNKYDNYKISK